MIFIREINPLSAKLLERIYRQSQKSQVRQRAHCLILANQGVKDAILDKFEEWHERNLRIFTLPTYSPQLNLIEILWRFIKYEWLEIDAYSRWENLVASGEKILKEFGENYVINFV